MKRNTYQKIITECIVRMKRENQNKTEKLMQDEERRKFE